MSKQRELIETIRQKEFGIGLDLQTEAKEVVDNLVRKYRSLLSTVAEDLNSKDSHFILELIQNADDNSYESNITPSLSFFLETNRLIVRNNEIGFEEKNVRALCSAGESSKKAEKLKGYIGEKGIGFKSIFKVTDSPEIHSNGYHFRFDRSNPDDLLGYVVPHWHEADIQLDGRTTLVIPAKSGQYFTSSTLVDINASLLLFLQKVRNLDVRTQDGQYNYQRLDNHSITSLVTTKKDEIPTRKDFLRKSFKLDMSDIHEPKREGVKETEIILAFPIDQVGSAAPISGCNTYAFLPIRDFGFKFYIQADFVLASSREDIHEDLRWNMRLRDAISDAFIEAIEEFKLYPEIALTYLRYIPNKDEIHNPFFLSVVWQIIEKLKTIECIQVASGGWRRPADVLITSEKIRELFLSEDAVCIFGADYIKDDFTLPPSLKKELCLKLLEIDDVVSIFLKHSDWLKNKSLGWKAKFYAYLSTNERYLKPLEKIPCVPLDDDSLVIPSKTTVFFPLSTGKKYGFEHELSILNEDILNQAIEAQKDIKLFFSKLGVKHDNAFDLVQSHILKLHKVNDWKKSDDDALIGHVRYIKDKFDEYIEYAIRSGQQETVAISQLRVGLYVGTKNKKIINDTKDWYFNRIFDLYLSKEFKPSFDLERLLKENISPELFIAPDYIASLDSGENEEFQEREV
ncbi:MAG: hypothetical protein VXY56_09575, partial [Pseudomonadota bacterium]|nr:hypothetical protein [Pseudomonadota bacterium]